VREKEYLRHRYHAIISSVGMILILSGVVMLTPLLVLITHPEEAAHAPGFGFPAACLAIAGIVLWRLTRSASSTSLSIQEGGIIVLTSWVVVLLFSAWPFVSVLGLPFSRALFESVSGWTTTGLSVVDVARAGPTRPSRRTEGGA
jgi:trk system potassium uptake protein TrkH